MKLNTFIACALLLQPLCAQTPERHDWVLGVAAGASAVRLSENGSQEWQTSLSFPNIRVGKMITGRSAVLLYLPGSIYREKRDGRDRDRGFEGIIPVYQFWPAKCWWILGGAGLAMDAPAFYDIQQDSERRFFFGPAVLAATGFEVWNRNRFALDIQARSYYGTAAVANGQRSSFAANVLIGANWYLGKR